MHGDVGVLDRGEVNSSKVESCWMMNVREGRESVVSLE